MRKVVVLAAVVAALAMGSQPTEARDGGFGFRQFSGHRHFGHFGHRGFAFRFGHAPHFKPRHFGHFRHPGLVLKFGDGDFVLRFGHVPHFKDRHFGRRKHHHGLFFGLDCHGSSGHIAALPFEDRRSPWAPAKHVAVASRPAS